MNSFYDQLNPVQKQAVDHQHQQGGPLLVLAGAGSGKTAVLTQRIVKMVEQGVNPHEILALTFTNKAAAEMRERVALILGERGQGIRLCTFHSLAYWILKQPIHGVPNWKRLGFARKPLLGTEDSEDAAQGQAKKSRLSFDQLLVTIQNLLETDQEVVEWCQKQFVWILIDEYQDIDPVQYRIVRLLQGNRPYLFAVGDDDQSIYGFRGADVQNILRWKKDFPAGTLLKLEWNYRSASPVLDVANRLFPRKPLFLQKTLRPGSRRQDSLFRHGFVQVNSFDNAIEEIEWISRKITDLSHQEGVSLSSIAILCRFNQQVQWYRRALDRCGIMVQDENIEGVQILTIHASKGLQYAVVLITGLNEGLLPAFPQPYWGRQRSRQHFAEEERLFYVAITRAECRLYLLSCGQRVWKGKAKKFALSRFFCYLDQICVKHARILPVPILLNKTLLLLQTIAYMTWACVRYAWICLFRREQKRIWLEKTLLKWAAFVVRLMKVDLNIQGLEKLDQVDWTRPVFVVANHQSYLDIPVVLLSLNRMLGFVAKKELDWIPLLGFWMRQIGSLVIQRNRKGVGYDVQKHLASSQYPPRIVIFPEGTRSKDGKLLPFRSGAFRFAFEMKGWIIPVMLRKTRSAWEDRERWEPCCVVSEILEPVDCGSTDQSVKQIQCLVKDQIQRGLEAHA